MPPKKYTAEVLAPIVASSHSLSQVIRKLGIPANGGNHRNIQAAIRYAGLDTSHFGNQFKAPIYELSRDELESLVKHSDSYAVILRHLGLPEAGRASRVLGQRIDELAIDTSHMQRELWSKGRTSATNPVLARMSKRTRYPDEVLFADNAPYTNGHRLARRLVEKGWPYECAICRITEWCGKRLVLHVDHINGINNDNRLENLRFLCPNCHSQTITYCARNRGKASRASERVGLCYTYKRSERGGIWWTRTV